jgi:hypothetical protein
MKRVGLALLALLSCIDIATLLLTDGSHPPYEIAAFDALLGATSLVLVVACWRGASKALLPLIVLRAISALTVVPVFVVNDIPAGVVAPAAGIVAATVLGIVLVARPYPSTGAAS